MLSFEHAGPRLCDGLTRREWLRIGLLGGVGAPASATRPGVAAGLALEGVAGFRKAKRVIMLFMLGGPPQHETWDPKPEAPEEIRGPFQPIATATPGLHVCELMPKTAALADRSPCCGRWPPTTMPTPRAATGSSRAHRTPKKSGKRLARGSQRAGLARRRWCEHSREMPAAFLERCGCRMRFGTRAASSGRARMLAGWARMPIRGW